MSTYRASALLASTALALGGVLVPAAAHADTPAPGPAFSIADLTTALTDAEAPTASAAAGGWVAAGTDTAKGGPILPMKVIYAVDRGLTDAGSAGTLVEAQHSGTYVSLATLGAERRTKKALKAVRKQRAAWVFMPDAALDLRDVSSDSAVAHLAPEQILKQMVDPAQTTLTGTPTATAGDDGSTTYSFTENDLTMGGDPGTVSLTISASRVLTGFTSVSATETGTGTYRYGPQQVALPPASRTITLERLVEGQFLANLPREVRSAATELAKGLTHRAHGRAVKVAAIRAAAKGFTRYTNRALGAKVFSTSSVAGGVRITGTNRYLHQHAAYTVTAAGTKAVVRKA